MDLQEYTLVFALVFTSIAMLVGFFYTIHRRIVRPPPQSVKAEQSEVSVGKTARIEPFKAQPMDNTAKELNDDMVKQWPLGVEESELVTAVSDGKEIDVNDPVEYCGHIQREVKKVKQRVAEKQITSSLNKDQLMEEREIQRKQLEDIFKLLENEKDKFGIGSVQDIEQQMKLYVQ